MTHENKAKLDTLIQRRLLSLLAKHYPRQAVLAEAYTQAPADGQTVNTLFWVLPLFALVEKQPGRFRRDYDPAAPGLGLFPCDDVPPTPSSRAMERAHRHLISQVLKSAIKQGEINKQGEVMPADFSR